MSEIDRIDFDSVWALRAWCLREAQKGYAHKDLNSMFAMAEEIFNFITGKGSINKEEDAPRDVGAEIRINNE